MRFSKPLLGPWDSAAIIIGIVVGVGIFRVPSEVAVFIDSPQGMLLAWVLGGFICLLGALCFGELAGILPATGGSYVYLRESYGSGVAFLYGWIEFVVVRPGSIAAVSFIAAEAGTSLLGLSSVWIKPLAVLGIVILSFVNLRGLLYGKWVQSIFAFFVVVILLSVFLGAVLSHKGTWDNLHAGPVVWEGGFLKSMSLALIPILWTYGGWHENTFLGGETKDPSRNIPRALILSILAITILYVLMNVTYLYLVPVGEFAQHPIMMAHALDILLGAQGLNLLNGFVILASLAGINGMIITSSRLTLALARDNAIFRSLSKTKDGEETTHRAIICVTAISMVLVALGTFHRLLFFTGIIVWLFFALITVSLFLLRLRFPHMVRPYKVFLYPVTPLLFLLVCAMLFFYTFLTYPFQSLIGLGLLILGIPVYALSRRMGPLTAP